MKTFVIRPCRAAATSFVLAAAFLVPLAAGAAGFRLVEDEERAKLDEERAGDEPAVTVDGTVVATKNRFRFVADPTRSQELGTVDFLLQWAPREPFVAEPSPHAWTEAEQAADNRFAAKCIADAFLLDREAKQRGFESGEAMVREGIAEPTEEELCAAWAAILAENPSAGRVGETVEASHLLVLVPEGASADDDAAALEKVKALRARILAGEDFAAVARESSNCPSKARGGSLGSFTRGQMVSAFEEAAFSQPVGVVGEPVRTEFGWHLVLVTKREPARERRFEEVRDDLKADLSAKKLEDRIERLLEPLRKAAVIQYAPGYDPAKSPVLYWNPATRSSATSEPHAESAEDAEPEPHAESAEKTRNATID